MVPSSKKIAHFLDKGYTRMETIQTSNEALVIISQGTYSKLRKWGLSEGLKGVIKPTKR